MLGSWLILMSYVLWILSCRMGYHSLTCMHQSIRAGVCDLFLTLKQESFEGSPLSNCGTVSLLVKINMDVMLGYSVFIMLSVFWRVLIEIFDMMNERNERFWGCNNDTIYRWWKPLLRDGIFVNFLKLSHGRANAMGTVRGWEEIGGSCNGWSQTRRTGECHWSFALRKPLGDYSKFASVSVSRWHRKESIYHLKSVEMMIMREPAHRAHLLLLMAVLAIDEVLDDAWYNWWRIVGVMLWIYNVGKISQRDGKLAFNLCNGKPSLRYGDAHLTAQNTPWAAWWSQ